MFRLALQRLTKGEKEKFTINKDGVKYTYEVNGDQTSGWASTKFEFDNVKYHNFIINGNYEMKLTAKGESAEVKYIWDNLAFGYTENSSLESQVKEITDGDHSIAITFEITGTPFVEENPNMYIRTVYSGEISQKNSGSSEGKPEGTVKATNYIGVEKGKINQIKEGYLSIKGLNIYIGNYLIASMTASITNTTEQEKSCGKDQLRGHFKYLDISAQYMDQGEIEDCFDLIDGEPELPAPTGIGSGGSDNTTTIIIVVVVVVVVLIAAGVGGFFLWKKFGSKKDEKEASV